MSRELIKQTISQLNTYRRPDITACQKEIACAIYWAKLGNIDKEIIVDLEIDEEDILHVTTEWGSKGSVCADTYKLPMYIFEAPCLITASMKYGLELKLEYSQDQLQMSKENVAHYEQEVNKYTKWLDEVNNDRYTKSVATGSK